MTGASTAVDRLAALVGWSGRSPYDPDWSSLQAAFGHQFPTDFRQYVERFPPGAFDFVQVFHPCESEYREDAAYYVDVLLWRTNPANGIEDYYRFGNKPGELFAWGTVNGELELCWELSSKPADTWTCVVADIPAGPEKAIQAACWTYCWMLWAAPEGSAYWTISARFCQLPSSRTPEMGRGRRRNQR
ncbi:hypothetical protein ABZ399_31000 [Micromonospora aurantiaca]|uniref:hypothetical protein n=1 Tax=Micromonospora aurantiaca (nom. illeg.) TaxID=47850 RepID=UPI0033F4D5AE